MHHHNKREGGHHAPVVQGVLEKMLFAVCFIVYRGGILFFFAVRGKQLCDTVYIGSDGDKAR